MVFVSLSSFSQRRPLQLLSNWAMPQDCVLCAGRSNALVCVDCERLLARPTRMSPRRVAAFDYAFPLDRLVHRFKFSGDLAIGGWLAGQLAEAARFRPRPDLLVAPPLTGSRLRERGFNQSLELARLVGRQLGVARAVDLVEKVRETPPQQGLGRRARRRNVRGAFRCTRRLDGERIAIVDDVVTTGATLAAVASALRAAGAGPIEAWTVARAPRGRER